MLLRKDDPWNRKLDLPDIRNWRVVDVDNRPVGFVESVIVDPQQNRFEAIFVGANERFAADEIDVGEQVIRVKASVERPSHDGARAQRSFHRYGEAFRDHFERIFTEREIEFDVVEEAYAFGRRMALDAHFAGRSYDRAREDLVALWITRRSPIPYERVEPAIRFAYELIREGARFEPKGLERERQQVLDGKRNPPVSEHAGAHMAMGRPRSSDEDILPGSMDG